MLPQYGLIVNKIKNKRKENLVSKSPFEIPAPVLKKLDELNEIVKDHPVYIPPQVAAKFLGMNPATLIASIQARQCPFAFGYQKNVAFERYKQKFRPLRFISGTRRAGC